MFIPGLRHSDSPAGLGFKCLTLLTLCVRLGPCKLVNLLPADYSSPWPQEFPCSVLRQTPSQRLEGTRQTSEPILAQVPPPWGFMPYRHLLPGSVCIRPLNHPSSSLGIGSLLCVETHPAALWTAICLSSQAVCGPVFVRVSSCLWWRISVVPTTILTQTLRPPLSNLGSLELP